MLVGTWRKFIGSAARSSLVLPPALKELPFAVYYSNIKSCFSVLNSNYHRLGVYNTIHKLLRIALGVLP